MRRARMAPSATSTSEMGVPRWQCEATRDRAATIGSYTSQFATSASARHAANSYSAPGTRPRSGQATTESHGRSNTRNECGSNPHGKFKRCAEARSNVDTSLTRRPTVAVAGKHRKLLIVIRHESSHVAVIVLCHEDYERSIWRTVSDRAELGSSSTFKRAATTRPGNI